MTIMFFLLLKLQSELCSIVQLASAYASNTRFLPILARLIRSIRFVRACQVVKIHVL